jgi:hypothetical protein
MKNKIRKLTVFILMSFFIILIIITYLPIGNNVWQLCAGKGYIIPRESSFFTFQPTVMNEGSGEWWLYGKDARFYYHFVGSPRQAYLLISRSRAEKCEGFDGKNYKTWCKH